MEQSRHTELSELTDRLSLCIEQFVSKRLSSDYRLRMRSSEARSVRGRLEGPNGMVVDCSLEISYFGGNIYHLRAKVGEEAQRTFNVCLPEPDQVLNELQTRVERLCHYLLRELYCEAGRRFLEGSHTTS